MNRRWASYHETQGGDQTLNNLNLLPTGIPTSSTGNYDCHPSEQVVSVPPNLIFGGAHSVLRTMSSRGKGGRVIKTDATSHRRGSRHSSLSSTAHEHLEAYAQQVASEGVAGESALLDQSTTIDPSGHLDDSLQLSATGVLHSSATGLPSSIQQVLAAEREGLHYLSDSHLSPSPGPADNAHLPGRTHNFVQSRTAADVAMDAYGDSLRIDSALCKKLAGEIARRDPKQRRNDQRLNIERRSNVEALLAHVTGELAPRPCKNCHKGHGPWTQCVVYEGQMCGSCTNCWFNASGSRCTFHENNNPQLPHFAAAASTSASSQSAQPTSLYQQTSTAATPSGASLQPDILQWAMADQTRQFLSQTVGDIVNLSKRGRYIARIESAAKELGMRIAEYDEYLQTPEGSAEQEQLEQERLAQQCQTGDTPMEESSPNGPLT